jgi:molecular chaperone GrpE
VPPLSREEGSGGETAERFPPEAGRAAGSSSETDDVARQRDEYREALQRVQADFENYRKRVAKQTEEIRERAAEQLVTLLLPVLDTADLALSHGAGEDVKQLSAGLFAVLEKEGLEKIDNAGEPFDPTHHDAVAHDPGETDGGQEVAEVMRAGYRWRGRVLRPAMVKVRG